jgi:hypothetical protein
MRVGLVCALPVVVIALVVVWLWTDAGILLLALAPLVRLLAELRLGRTRPAVTGELPRGGSRTT